MQREPTIIDRRVGRALKRRRIELGLSQERVAKSIGVTFQQIQKYESGHNRISAGRLYQLSLVLDTRLHYFFEKMDEDVLEESAEGLALSERQEEKILEEETVNGEVAKLAKFYRNIGDYELRKCLLRFIINISKLKKFGSKK